MRKLDITEVQALQLSLMKKLHAFMEEKNIKYYMIAGSALGAVRHKGFIPWDDDIDIGLFREDYEKFLNAAKEFDPRYEIINHRNAHNCDFCLTRIYIPNTKIDNPVIANTGLDQRLYMDVFPLDNVPDSIDERIAFEKRIKKRKSILEKTDVRNYGNTGIVLFCKSVISFILKPNRNIIISSTERLMKMYDSQKTEAVCSLCSQYSFKKQVMLKEIYGTPTMYAFEDTSFYGPEKIDAYLTTLYGANYMQIPPISKRRKGHDILMLD
jgi:lipopolysaccharide cholinephosphotransferase